MPSEKATRSLSKLMTNFDMRIGVHVCIYFVYERR